MYLVKYDLEGQSTLIHSGESEADARQALQRKLFAEPHKIMGMIEMSNGYKLRLKRVGYVGVAELSLQQI